MVVRRANHYTKQVVTYYAFINTSINILTIVNSRTVTSRTDVTRNDSWLSICYPQPLAAERHSLVHKQVASSHGLSITPSSWRSASRTTEALGQERPAAPATTSRSNQMSCAYEGGWLRADFDDVDDDGDQDSTQTTGRHTVLDVTVTVIVFQLNCLLYRSSYFFQIHPSTS